MLADRDAATKPTPDPPKPAEAQAVSGEMFYRAALTIHACGTCPQRRMNGVPPCEACIRVAAALSEQALEIERLKEERNRLDAVLEMSTRLRRRERAAREEEMADGR